MDLNGSAEAKQLADLPQEVVPTHAVLWAADNIGIGQQMLHLGVKPNEVKVLPTVPPAALFDRSRAYSFQTGLDSIPNFGQSIGLYSGNVGLFDVRVEVDGVGTWQVSPVNEPRDYRLQMQGTGAVFFAGKFLTKSAGCCNW